MLRPRAFAQRCRGLTRTTSRYRGATATSTSLSRAILFWPQLRLIECCARVFVAKIKYQIGDLNLKPDLIFDLKPAQLTVDPIAASISDLMSDLISDTISDLISDPVSDLISALLSDLTSSNASDISYNVSSDRYQIVYLSDPISDLIQFRYSISDLM